MSLTSIIMMIIVLSVIWGGFIFMLRVALRNESKKTAK